MMVRDQRTQAARNPGRVCRQRSRAGKGHVPFCGRQARRLSRERRWRWRGESPTPGQRSRGRRSRRRARAQGRVAAAAPRAPGTARHLAQSCWAASDAASASRASNTFSLNFPAPVPANTHSRTHTRAPGEPLRGWRTGTRGSLAASFSLPRSYWRGGYCFIYLFPPLRSVPPPRASRPLPSLPRLLRPPVRSAAAGAPAAAWRGCALRRRLRRPGGARRAGARGQPLGEPRRAWRRRRPAACRRSGRSRRRRGEDRWPRCGRPRTIPVRRPPCPGRASVRERPPLRLGPGPEG